MRYLGTRAIGRFDFFFYIRIKLDFWTNTSAKSWWICNLHACIYADLVDDVAEARIENSPIHCSVYDVASACPQRVADLYKKKFFLRSVLFMHGILVRAAVIHHNDEIQTTDWWQSHTNEIRERKYSILLKWAKSSFCCSFCFFCIFGSLRNAFFLSFRSSLSACQRAVSNFCCCFDCKKPSLKSFRIYSGWNTEDALNALRRCTVCIDRMSKCKRVAERLAIASLSIDYLWMWWWQINVFGSWMTVGHYVCIYNYYLLWLLLLLLYVLRLLCNAVRTKCVYSVHGRRYRVHKDVGVEVDVWPKVIWRFMFPTNAKYN